MAGNAAPPVRRTRGRHININGDDGVFSAFRFAAADRCAGETANRLHCPAFYMWSEEQLRSRESACLPATFEKRCPTACEDLAGARSSLRPGRTFSHIADGSKRMPRDFFDPTPEHRTC
jgi:hypothetical protein